MKKIILLLASTLLATIAFSQSPGDTIVVKAFKYGSPGRDTMLNFPSNPNLTFEKIIMKYNMRCKNNLVSTQSLPNQGCGEWDYSCNTFVADSSKVELDPVTAPSHIITNFSGTLFPYSNAPVYDYYAYSQNSVTLGGINSESQYSVGLASTNVSNLLMGNQRSGRTQLLFTAAELTAAGFSAGNIDALLLNVTNAGGGVNFFKVGLQHTTLTALSAATPTLTGFTTVYNQNYNFTAGNNRIQFFTPFVWNGTSNVLIDLSFTNSVPTNPIVFGGATTAGNMAMYANNNYALDLSYNGHAMLNNAQLNQISNEITISFWAYGDLAQISNGNSLFYGVAANSTQRQLNIHLPWSDNYVYFDCGNVGNAYDRVSKTTVPSERGGQWNHWVFTKNATAGTMRVYLNGVQWLLGNNKIKPVSLFNLVLGKDLDLNNNFKGKINEICIWNAEISAADIVAWMNKPITNAHPNYNNLIAYYKANEGTGQVINDSKFNLTSTGTNLQWSFDRGHNLTRMFTESASRPRVVFLRGNYTLNTSTISMLDSVPRYALAVQQYSITNNSAAVPFMSDAVVPTVLSSLYSAAPSVIYDGNTGAPTGTVNVTPAGTITITQMPYIKRYPYYVELLSFVTPYGKGLSMGANGKSWYYDLTDFAPVLRGKKRFFLTMGGEYQEQMDIDFWFIVGTPPHDVLQFNQLWQGAARLGGVPINSITNDSRFSAQSVPLLANAQAFKLRSTITGHGAEGEFSQNGGVVNHMFNINGGAPEFVWPITQECSYNVIFPQGGTWVYDRQGWCPGQTSLTKEFNLTPYLTAGTTATLDYTTSNPQIPTGDYRYLVANQLISYGMPNHNNDACVVDVLAPSNRVLYSRKNPICANPRILLKNTGASALSSVVIDYWVNNANAKQTYTWTGNLAFLDTTTVILPIGTLWQDGLTLSNNVFHVELKTANGAADDYVHNNKFHSPFTLPDVVTENFTIEFKTNAAFTQNNYRLVDEDGNVVGTSAFAAGNTVYQDDYALSGCFTLFVDDSGNDGLAWWANPNQGTGYCRLKNDQGAVVKTFEPDFGGGFQYSFSTRDLIITGLSKNTLGGTFNLYPNPSVGHFVMEGSALDGASVTVLNVLGQEVFPAMQKKEARVEVDTRSLQKGIYFVTLVKDGNSMTRKVVVN